VLRGHLVEKGPVISLFGRQESPARRAVSLMQDRLRAERKREKLPTTDYA
jgi:hypothetical protein